MKSLNICKKTTCAFLAAIFALGSAAATHAAVVGYWRFEEGTAGDAASGTGTIIDSSPTGDNGTAINSPIYSSDVPTSVIPSTGAANTLSMSFNGTNQRIAIPDNPALAITQSLTLEAYINPLVATNTHTEQVVFRGDNRGGLDPYKITKINGNLDFQISDANGDTSTVTAAIPNIGQWLFVAGTLNDATGAMDLYFNDTLVASTTTTIRPYATLDSTEDPGLGIGNTESGDYNEYFDGLIDEVRISNTALTPGEFLDDVPEPASATIVFGIVSILGLTRPNRQYPRQDSNL